MSCRGEATLLLVSLTAAVMPAAAGTREEFKAAVVSVQKAPADRALREKVIALSLKLKPAPAVPAEARRPFVMAATYQKEAKKPAEFGLAVDSYREAVRLAPWWGDAYYNLSVALESAGRLDESREALSLYLLTKPKDAERAQDRLFALEAKKNLASKQAMEAQEAKRAEESKQAESLIVPGKSVGHVRLGMTDAEVGGVLGVQGEPGQYVREFRTTDLTAKSGMESGRVTHIQVWTKQYVTAEGVGVGSSSGEVSAAFGSPSEHYSSPNASAGSGHCYLRNDGATWFWYDDAQSVKYITVVPGCNYR